MRLLYADDITTRHMVTFDRAVRRFKDPRLADYKDAPIIEGCLVAVQAAIEAGWFLDHDDLFRKPADVMDAPKNDVVRWGTAVLELYWEVQKAATIPKN